MIAYGDPPWLKKVGLGASVTLHAALPALAFLLWQAPVLTTAPMPNRGVTMLTLLPPSTTPAAQPRAENTSRHAETVMEKRKATTPKPAPANPKQSLIATAGSTSSITPAAPAAEPAATTTVAATSSAEPAAAAPAPSPSSNLGIVEFPMSYLARMSRTIDNRIHYPASGRDARQQGTAFVRVRLARDGSVLEATLLETTGFVALDEEARNVILRIRQFRPIPEDVMPQQREFVIHQPVQFALR